MIPPRGCAYIVMIHRQDAYRALQKLSRGPYKVNQKAIKVSDDYFITKYFCFTLFKQIVKMHKYAKNIWSKNIYICMYIDTIFSYV